MQRKDLNYLKYLKYKNKYLNLRNQIGGGINEEVEKIMQEANRFIANDQYQEALDYINTQNDEHKKRAFMRLENEQNDDWYYIKVLIEVETIMQEANRFIANDQYQEALEYINTQNDEHKNLAFTRLQNEQSDDWYYIRNLIYKEHDKKINEEVDKIVQQANNFIANEQYKQAVEYILQPTITVGKKNRVFRKFRDTQPDVWKKLMPFIPDEDKLATR